MRFIIIAILLLGAGGGGIWYYKAAAAEKARLEKLAQEQKEKEAQEQARIAAEQARLRDPAVSGEGLPADLKDLLKATDARWAELQAQGDPVTGPEAPSIAAKYTRIFAATWNRPDLKTLQDRLLPTLSDLGKNIFLTNTPYAQDASGVVKMHKVNVGEKLDDIGRQYGLSREHINMMRGRDVKDAKYDRGDLMKVIDALKNHGFFLHIDKSDFTMDVIIAGIFCKRYSIGHGKAETPTPVGKTKIVSREKEMRWTDPKTKKVYKYGEEGHILGPVWMAFDPVIGRPGLGIHGFTGEGQVTGALVSNGCIRMNTNEAIELYNILVPAHKGNDGKFYVRAPMQVEIVE
jgi:hypothetical protein